MIVGLSSWKSLALRGAAALLFGILTLIWPAISLIALILLFGVYALVDGASIFVAAAARDSDGWGSRGLLFLHAALGVLVGIITFIWPGITALALLYLIAAWALVTGALQLVAAVRLRKQIQNEWLLGLTGALSVVLGILLAIRPGEGVLAVTWLIGPYAFLVGILLLALAFRIRKLAAAAPA